MNQREVNCPDCHPALDRREFVKLVGGAAVASGVLPLVGGARPATAAPTPNSPAETAVKRFYDLLSYKQRQTVCFPFDHPLREKISANWHITEPAIGDDFYTGDQRQAIQDILRGVTSEDGYRRFLRQMEDDAGGFDQYNVAVFGTPGSGKFQWEMTGRHLTVRADGDSVSGAAFGGPIIYGHGESDPSKNLFHYQTKAANAVFEALDAPQREAALLENAPAESQVPLQGGSGKFPGIAVGSLSADQQELAESVIKVILAPYRTEDVDEALATLKQGGALEKLHMAFYRTGDLNSDQVWDIWRLEGPSFVWHFRGAPHVHTYVNIGTGG